MTDELYLRPLPMDFSVFFFVFFLLLIHFYIYWLRLYNLAGIFIGGNSLLRVIFIAALTKPARSN